MLVLLGNCALSVAVPLGCVYIFFYDIPSLVDVVFSNLLNLSFWLDCHPGWLLSMLEVMFSWFW